MTAPNARDPPPRSAQGCQNLHDPPGDCASSKVSARRIFFVRPAHRKGVPQFGGRPRPSSHYHGVQLVLPAAAAAVLHGTWAAAFRPCIPNCGLCRWSFASCLRRRIPCRPRSSASSSFSSDCGYIHGLQPTHVSSAYLAVPLFSSSSCLPPTLPCPASPLPVTYTKRKHTC